MAHVYEPRYAGGKNQEDCGLSPIRIKIYQGSISTNKMGMVAHFCSASYSGSIGRRISVQGDLRLYLKNKLKVKMSNSVS
jgi:hypothetical protein